MLNNISENQGYQKSGFTLVELICSLVLVGIIGMVGSTMIIQLVQGFVLTRTATELTQIGQFAMTRIAKEFSGITNISMGTSNDITYTFRDHAAAHRVYYDSGQKKLMLDSDGNPATSADCNTLADRVSAFTLTYYNRFTDTGSDEPSASTSLINIEFTLADGFVQPSFEKCVWIRK
ncbi:MAG: type II secretion system protein [Desulfobacterales bacterium]|nr:type II secretion system protein [Desulfobacterales bacterium]